MGTLPDRFEAAEELPPTPFERTLRAYDRVLERRVLLKLPGAGAWSGWKKPLRDQLLSQARALARIRHPGVEPIHWVEETADGPVLVLDLPEGELLRDRLEQGPLGIDETRELGIQLAEALGVVHYQGIVHRAVSADSVRVLADDRVQLCSFTFAKGFEARPHISSIDHSRRLEPEVEQFLPPYVAPEQLAGHGADPRTDVFALGCLLYRCLAGRDPFEPGGSKGWIATELRRLRSDVPKDLAEVLRRCMHMVPTARYPTAVAVAQALRASRPTEAALPGRRGRFVALAGAALVLAGLALWAARDGAPQRESIGQQGTVVSGPTPDQIFAPHYERCHALFIGVAQAYGPEHGKLENPVQEVRAIAERLQQNDAKWREQGAIRILEEHEAKLDRIHEEFQRLESDAVGPEDAVLVYFSGHGVLDDQMYHLVPAGTQGNPLLGQGYLPESRIRNLMNKCRAKHLLFVLDCCYAGSSPLFVATKGRTAAQPASGAEFEPFLRHKARQLIGSAKDKAADGRGRSPFCQAFLAALEPGKSPYRQGFVHARWLHNYIATELSRQHSMAAGVLQEPAITEWGDGKGSFVFFLDQAAAGGPR